MDEFEGLEMHFGISVEPIPFELKFASNYLLEVRLDPQQLIGGRVQYDDVWYVIVDYNFETQSYTLEPE